MVENSADAPAMPWSLLCVDDNRMVLAALRRLFRRHGFRVLLADSGASGLRVLEREPVDAVIADMRMPGMSGAQFLEQARARWPEAIRFLLTGYADLTSAVAAINHGGISRYFSKPWNDDELLRAVRQALENRALTQRRNDELRRHNDRLAMEVMECKVALENARTDILKVKDSEKRASYLAQHDALTGLPNRLLFEMRMQHAIAQAQRRGDMLAVLFVDLDRFKEVNDRFGHAAGDMFLQEVARSMRAVLRHGDTLARFGGDEFLVLVEGIESEAVALAMAEKLLAVFPRHADGLDGRIAVSASIGISLYPRDGDNAAQLIDRADGAMYRAKAGGRAGLRLSGSQGMC